MVLPSCVESLLLKQNPTLIYLRNVKSFVFRAGRKVPLCLKWDCATAFGFGHGHFEAVFNFYFNSRRETGAPNPRVGACGNPAFGVAT